MMLPSMSNQYYQENGTLVVSDIQMRKNFYGT